MTDKVTSYISLGSNLGAKEENILESVWRIGASQEVEVVGLSSLYESQPQGVETGNIFINAVVKLVTSLGAEELLDYLLSIEEEMGRERRGGVVDRKIDLDILLYGEEIINSDRLIVPHPLLRERPFVLVPLSEIEPSLLLPPDKEKKVEDVLSAVIGRFWVRRVSGRLLF